MQTVLQKKKQIMQKLRLKYLAAQAENDFLAMAGIHHKAVKLNQIISKMINKET